MILIALAGILAALCLFRRARTVALFLFGGLVLWSLAAHAQRSTIVDCAIGQHAVQVTDWQCDVLQDVYDKLRRVDEPVRYGPACADELARRFGSGGNMLCSSMVGDVNLERRNKR